MIDSLENKGLSLFRVLLVASFWIFLIGAVLFYAYAGFKLATNSAENIDPPKLDSGYVPPKVGPVEMRKARERLRDAKRSFESKFDDAVDQITQVSAATRKQRREISQRYMELQIKPETANSPSALTKLSASQYGEFLEMCSIAKKSIAGHRNDLESSLSKIAIRFSVEAKDVSNDHAEKLDSVVRLPKECAEYVDVVVQIAKNLRGAMPTSWGIDSSFGTFNAAKNKKDDLERVLLSLYNAFNSEIDDEKYVENLFEGMVSYTDQLENYYSDQRETLEARNLFVSETAEDLAKGVADDFGDYVKRGVDNYEGYVAAVELAEQTADLERAGIIALITASTVIFAVMLAILILLGFFAMERHQRNLRNLIEKASPSWSEQGKTNNLELNQGATNE
jgi:hypothetical protein